VPIFFAQRPSGRPFNADDRFTSKYLDVANEPEFPFGHGLTYGQFAQSNLRVSAGSVSQNDAITVLVDVINQGMREAQETLFMFTRDKLASIVRPVLELKGFAKISLAPGQSGTISLTLRGSDLYFLGANLKPVFEPGEVEVFVGPCADQAQLLSTTIQLVWSGPR
jgi:beta-glucosidase